MDTRTKEVIRYLGYGKHVVDDQTLLLVSDSFLELDAIVDKRIIYRIFELEQVEEDKIKIGKLKIHSRQLVKNVKGCERVVLLGATLGVSVDMFMRRLSLMDMAKAVVVQSCAAVLLEEYLDEEQSKIKSEAEQEGYYLRPRFSPGYGDFSIEHQRGILTMLDAAKKIGLTMTESSMLTPTKSVTALIGMSQSETACHRSGCEVCGKLDCIYRR